MRNGHRGLKCSNDVFSHSFLFLATMCWFFLLLEMVGGREKKKICLMTRATDMRQLWWLWCNSMKWTRKKKTKRNDYALQWEFKMVGREDIVGDSKKNQGNLNWNEKKTTTEKTIHRAENYYNIVNWYLFCVQFSFWGNRFLLFFISVLFLPSFERSLLSIYYAESRLLVFILSLKLWSFALFRILWHIYGIQMESYWQIKFKHHTYTQQTTQW